MKNLEKTRILILGINGFLGKNFVNYLNTNKFKVLSIVRKKKNYYPKNFKIIQSDIGKLNQKTFQKIKKFKPEVILNFAWHGIPDYSFDNSLKNVIDQTSFFKKISEINSIKKIISIGSCWEYSDNIGKCKLTSKLNMTTYFSWAKNAIYNYLVSVGKRNKIEIIWFRVFYMYGKFQKNKSLMPLIINSLKNKKKPIIKNFDNRNDYVHVDDVCNAIFLSIIKRSISGIFNLGGEKTYSVLEVFNKISEKLGYNVKNKNLSTKKQINVIYNFSDNHKTLKNLKWKPKINIDLGINKMINFYYGKKFEV